ncbi:cell wall-active antibiotics response protein LiaF [Pontibacillus salicampi]|uniref:Cell wall-active antibiotics response protein LiaF n=1 Tax=Pontibacillus salicampi TaxID=1449801 RepID=A0ABV6LKJ3_9BACI
MFSKISTNTINWIIIIGVALLGIEIAFFNGELIFSLLFASILAYIGRRYYYKTYGKVLFWIGIIMLAITVMNMIAVRFLIIVGFALFLQHHYKSKQGPVKWDVSFEEAHSEAEALFQTEPLIPQKLLGDHITSEIGYEWHDITIHGGVGDRVLDLSNTVLPEDSFIAIRHFIGNIEIYVPYEIEISIHHSSLFGRANILGQYHMNIMNQQLSYHTADYYTTKPRVKIMTSLLSGDIEVKRI